MFYLPHLKSIHEGYCYDFEQLRQLLTVVFRKEVSFREGFRVWNDESFVIGQQRLATEQGCSTVVYILGKGIVKVWKTYGMCV